ncbi:hypothetical protein NW762_012383 [Fusarium torreyae]|uniref:PD-(D/E)XK nuclease-like domain-containing protein n=1 Tax=Fusarium torreyae TaxID=1237075 RepID=A0A9W8RMF9_9HYPO|nr:hypothetical protein NW762_012383 [Fusarium torreyae]
MEFNLSVGQVAHWLDTLPFDQSATTSEAQQQRAIKRRRSLEPTESRKRRYPISPPASQLDRGASLPNSSRSSKADRREAMPPSTPNKASGKRPIEDNDNEQTPRADTISTSRRPTRNAPSLSSQSDAAYSRDSKRSKRSQSPSKLFPLYGPEGRRLVRDSLSMAAPAHSLSPTLRLLIGDINDVAGRYGIMPRRIKTALEQRLEVTNPFDRLHEYMFFDDGVISGSDTTLEDCTRAPELVRRALRIADRSNECSRMLSDESAWNNLVHSPLLDMLVYDMQDGPGQDVLDFMPCTTTSIESAYHRFPDAASRVDYVIRLLPDHDPSTEESLDPSASGVAPCLNWTSDRLLQQYPLAFSIETKRYGGNTAKGEQQMGIWHAAQWEFLTLRAGPEPINDLGFLPGVVVQGHTWSLVITTRRQATTTVLCSVEFGNTSSIVGVFQVIAGLRRLRSWSLDVLWPWYKKHLPDLSHSPGAGEQTVNTVAGVEPVNG